MGKHGAVENATTRKRKLDAPRSKATADLDPPADLTGPAKEHWIRHASNLAKADLLSVGDLDSFRQCCICYGVCKALEADLATGDNMTWRRYRDANKLYMSWAERFCLLPLSRKKAAVSWGDNLDRHNEKDEFDF